MKEWRRTIRAWEENGRWYEESSDWTPVVNPSLVEIVLVSIVITICAAMIIADYVGV